MQATHVGERLVDERGKALASNKNFEDAGPIELAIYVKLAVVRFESPQISTNLDTANGCDFHKSVQPQAPTKSLAPQIHSSAAALETLGHIS